MGRQQARGLPASAPCLLARAPGPPARRLSAAAPWPTWPQVFVDAPHAARGAAPRDVREAFPGRDYYEWFTTEGAVVRTGRGGVGL